MIHVIKTKLAKDFLEYFSKKICVFIPFNCRFPLWLVHERPKLKKHGTSKRNYDNENTKNISIHFEMFYYASVIFITSSLSGRTIRT